MKGYLQKTEQGWVVFYDQRSWQDPSAEDGILPLHIQNEVNILNNKDYFNYYSGKEVEFEIVKLYDDKYGHELIYARLIRKTVHTDENGKPLTYWGGLEKSKQESYICPHTNVQCDDECCVSAENCNIDNDELEYPISEDCEAVKNWDSFVEQKNNELEIEKLAEISSELQEATYTIQHKTTYKHGFIDGYNEAKETLYTKQDLIDLVQGLKDYTKESHTILGHDDREAIDFVDIFLDPSNY